MKRKFREATTYFCPRGCNVFTTDERDPECGACGTIMTTDETRFGDAIEAIEEQGIRDVEKAARRGTPDKSNLKCRPG